MIWSTLVKPYPLNIFLIDDRGLEYLVATKVMIATKEQDRMNGLIGIEELPSYYGMLLYPCNAIHMRGVKFPIDVVYMDMNMQVVRVVRHINPGLTDEGHKNAYYTLELPADTIGFNPISMRMVYK
ncbi:MAG: hypothetical protein CVU84_14010 [Firmicutes bacterium HGW-Firmicutes-1]|jgi:hypothetical protein|nr:MAG: hypothetical protein CVU84_14010 [Firmicutes bacterium HGW-Firmicutes-1]